MAASETFRNIGNMPYVSSLPRTNPHRKNANSQLFNALNCKFFDEGTWDKLFFMPPDAENFKGVTFQPNQKTVAMIFNAPGVDDNTSI